MSLNYRDSTLSHNMKIFFRYFAEQLENLEGFSYKERSLNIKVSADVKGFWQVNIALHYYSYYIADSKCLLNMYYHCHHTPTFLPNS